MILKAENIQKSFRRKQVLKGVSFGIERGKMIGIVGENGSGKSTLLKIIVGEIKAGKGKITTAGRLGYCPQETLVFPELTVNEHFLYFSKAYKITKEQLHQQSNILLKHFNFKKYGNVKVSELSGGTRQKLNLSLALVHEPDLLVLDEPYNGFDWETYLRFWEFTDFLLQKGCSILIVTHFIDKTSSFHTIFELKNGVLQ